MEELILWWTREMDVYLTPSQEFWILIGCCEYDVIGATAEPNIFFEVQCTASMAEMAN